MNLLIPYISLIILLCIQPIFAQYPPEAGKPGSTAMFRDSSVFVSWATACTVTRGLMDISAPAGGNADYGTDASGTGKADNAVVSLGDGGSAILSFDIPVANGPGFDFAIFENSFSDFFLELAQVEVSSDGVNFFRFASVSLTPADTQVGSFDNLVPELINNFAGKYRGGYGTPFDLEELKNVAGLNVNRVTHIRVTDVVGCIQDLYAVYDSQGNKVNDPWPTPFPTGGFDLDAIGVINNINNTSVPGSAMPNGEGLQIYPNPFGDYICISANTCLESYVTLSDISGRNIYTGQLPKNGVINLSDHEPGVYLLTIKNTRSNIVKRIVHK